MIFFPNPKKNTTSTNAQSPIVPQTKQKIEQRNNNKVQNLDSNDIDRFFREYSNKIRKNSTVLVKKPINIVDINL